MIYGNLSEFDPKKPIFSGYPACFIDALEYLQKQDFAHLEPKRYDIRGDEIYLILADYETRLPADKKAEQHHEYIDIHYVVSGAENIGIGYNNPENKLLKEYDSGTDCLFHSFVKDETYFPLLPGHFMILFPNEIHRPQLNLNGQNKVRKVVVKVKVDMLNE